MYYREAAAVVVVYDVSNAQTFQVMKDWVKELQEHTELEPVALAIVGNKTDLVDQRAVMPEQGASFAKSLRDSGMNVVAIECSAKTGDNVKDVFTQLGQQILELAQAQEQKR